MAGKKKWKMADDGKAVNVYKVPKSLYDELCSNKADYELLVSRIIDGRRVIEDGNKALVDLLYKVKDSKDGPAKKFWVDRIEALTKVTTLVSSARDRLLLIESEYRNLYEKYARLREYSKDLEERLHKYETLEDE